jgi:hypothetical protein
MDRDYTSILIIDIDLATTPLVVFTD